MAYKTPNFQLFMGPKTLGAPDDLEAAITGFIDRAEPKDKLYIAVQELESEPITRAVVEAAQRGAKIRIVLEVDYLKSKSAWADPFYTKVPPENAGFDAAMARKLKRESRERNRYMLQALFRSGIEVRTDFNSSIFHQKFIVHLRANKPFALLTGSTNFTPEGCHENLNHVAVFDDATIAKEYKKEFDEIWGGTFGNKPQRHDPAPNTGFVDNIPYKILFAPDHAPEMEIMKQVAKARDRIDFAMFTFSGSSGIDDALMAQSRAGLDVRGVIDVKSGKNRKGPTKPLMDEGVKIRTVARTKMPDGHKLNQLHHKLMVIDKRVVIGGSFNYTGNANKLNDENIFILGDLDQNGAAARKREEKVGAFALAEIDRIFDIFGLELPPGFPNH